MRRLDCHNRIKQIKGSYETALQTVKVLLKIIEENPNHLYQLGLDLAEMRLLAEELHDLYFVRMFACFESSIRHYWWTKVRQTKPTTQTLLSSVANKRGVPQDTRDAVHEIREFRNGLIHEDHPPAKRFPLEDASRILNTYLARLPLEW